jgi:hypothetical protein
MAIGRYRGTLRRGNRGSGPVALLRYNRHQQPNPRELQFVTAHDSLLSGSWVKVSRSLVPGAPGHRIETKIVFNASRFFRHHGALLGRSDTPVNHEWLWPAVNDQSAAAAFDGNDNWIEEAALRRAVVWWQDGLTQYTAATFRRIEAEILAALLPEGTSSDGRLALFGHRQWVDQAEVYWEFSAPDALDRAAYFGRSMQAGSGYDSRTTIDYRHNAAMFRTYVGKDKPVAVSTYAKLRDRVRFEVQYEGDIGREVGYAGETDLVERLLEIRRKAAIKLGKALKWVEQDKSEKIGSPRSALLNLFEKVSIACRGDPKSTVRVLSALLSSPRVLLPAAGIPEDVQRRLAAQHVLVGHRVRPKTDPQPRYRLAPLFEWTVYRLEQAFPPTWGVRWTGLLRDTNEDRPD